MTTTTPVWIIRLVLKPGSSSAPPDSSSGRSLGSLFSALVSSGTTTGTLPRPAAGDPLEALDHRADRAHRGGEDRVGAAQRGDPRGGGVGVGEGMLAGRVG